MVTNASSFGRSGAHDYVLLRASALLLASYVIFIIGFIAVNSPLTFVSWQALFAALPMKIYTLVALIGLLMHAWIGVWQVLTDYVKHIALRGLLQFAFVLVLLSYLAAGLIIVWGV